MARVPFLPLVLSASFALAGSAHAVTARVDATTTQMRDGARIVAPVDKVSSTDLPVFQNAAQTFGPIVPIAGNPSSSTGIIQFSGTVTFLADPNDPPGATVCVSYTFDAASAASVDVLDGSIAGGIASPTGFVLDASAAPATVAAPNGLALILTPTVGPVQTIFSSPPQTYARATLGGGASFVTRRGRFSAQAGDVVSWSFETAGAARAEVPAGQSSISEQRMRLSISAGCVDAPVPALSGGALGLLSALLALLALAGGLAARRRPR